MMHSSLYKIVLSLVILAVAVAFGIVIFSSGSQTNQAADTSADLVVQEESKNVSELPPFASGMVDKVEGDRVYFTGGAQGGFVSELQAVVTNDTQIVKQVKTNGILNIENAELSDIQSGDSIVVYYASESQNQFTATKIQVIN
jgi:hypothetical protein